MRNGLCPYCGRVSRWLFRNYSLSLPPTGGDYEWVETDGLTTCPHCQNDIKVRIRVDLDDQRCIRLISSPFPTTVDWHRYVVGEVRMWSKNHVSVTVRHIAEDAAEAEAKLEVYGGAYRGQHDWRGVLQMSCEGYEKLDGERLPESAKQEIKYG
jgi:hypothetical protein